MKKLYALLFTFLFMPAIADIQYSPCPAAAPACNASIYRQPIGVLTPPTDQGFGLISAMTNLSAVASTLDSEESAISVATLGLSCPTEEAVQSALGDYVKLSSPTTQNLSSNLSIQSGYELLFHDGTIDRALIGYHDYGTWQAVEVGAEERGLTLNTYNRNDGTVNNRILVNWKDSALPGDFTDYLAYISDISGLQTQITQNANDISGLQTSKENVGVAAQLITAHNASPTAHADMRTLISNNTTAISNETTRATNAESNLQSQINGLGTSKVSISNLPYALTSLSASTDTSTVSLGYTSVNTNDGSSTPGTLSLPVASISNAGIVNSSQVIGWDAYATSKLNISDVVVPSNTATSTQAARADSTWTQIQARVATQQGSANEGKILQVGADGNLVLVQASIDAMTAGPGITIDGNNQISANIDGTSITVNGAGVLSAIAAPAPAAWGTITGTLANQTDLNNALNARALIQQGSGNAGKLWAVGNDGNLVLINPPAPSIWTNSTAGAVLGSANEGQIYAEPDGTGSVNGWDALVGDVATNTSTIGNLGTLAFKSSITSSDISGNIPASMLSGIVAKTQGGFESDVSSILTSVNANKVLSIDNSGNLDAIDITPLQNLGFPDIANRISIPVTGQDYIWGAAPSNGFLVYSRAATAASQYQSWVIDNVIVSTGIAPATGNVVVNGLVPVAAGSIVRIQQNLGGTFNYCYFIPAKL